MNGVGKTTTIGKLANRLRREGGRSVLVAAADTYRAGAVEQLGMWAERVGAQSWVGRGWGRSGRGRVRYNECSAESRGVDIVAHGHRGAPAHPTAT